MRGVLVQNPLQLEKPIPRAIRGNPVGGLPRGTMQ